MALQNRVTPWGEIVATAARGLFTGNRGILHAPEGKRLTNRLWTSQAWLICSCDWKGRRREVMVGRKWTELFFLDEVTALAAGHRPCFLCRREAALTFRACWAVGRAIPSAPQLDAVLHRERLNGRSKRLHPLPSGPVPVGVMAAAGDTAWLWAGRWLRWSPEGYLPGNPPFIEGMLTPPATLSALRAGYAPVLHATASPLCRGPDDS